MFNIRFFTSDQVDRGLEWKEKELHILRNLRNWGPGYQIKWVHVNGETENIELGKQSECSYCSSFSDTEKMG